MTNIYLQEFTVQKTVFMTIFIQKNYFNNSLIISLNILQYNSGKRTWVYCPVMCMLLLLL